MKALVTGATGFIGSHLVEELIKRGYDVTCLVRRTSSLKWIDGLKVNLIYGDCEEGNLTDIPEDIEYVYHVAGLTKARKDEEFFCVNAKGTENLLRAISFRARGLKRFLYLSSLAAVGPGENGRPVNELYEPRPVSSYGKSKLEGEIITLRYGQDIPVTVIRPPAVYGPRDKDLFVFLRMLKRGFYPYWGKCYYSMLYVDDLVRGMILAAENDGAVGKIYFFSDGGIYSNDELVSEMILTLNTKVVKVRVPLTMMSFFLGLAGFMTGRTSIINKDKLREVKYSYWVCDSTRAETELGFKPKVKIKEGIKWTVDWYRIHQWI